MIAPCGDCSLSVDFKNVFSELFLIRDPGGSFLIGRLGIFLLA